jgi:AcrR family transcriptional regulator
VVTVKRSYDAAGRRARADAQRATTYAVARELFLRDGYVETTVEAIGRAAGVSAATVYKTYGGKAGLVAGLVQQALAGSEAVPAETRSNAVRASGDAREVIAAWAGFTAEIAPVVSPLFLVLRDAARVDADAAAVYAEFDAQRLRRMRDNASFLVGTGAVRPDLSVNDVRDVLWLASAPELYELLVVRRRWPVKKFAGYVDDMMVGALL